MLILIIAAFVALVILYPCLHMAGECDRKEEKERTNEIR